MLSSIPLLVIPFILYNLGLAGIFGGGLDGNPWAIELFSFSMMSGGVFSMTLGILLIVIALLLLFVEIVKSTRTSNASILDHLLSTFVFVAFLVEFLLVKGAATSVFFTLMVITLIDVLAGFSVSLRAAGRDVTVN
jgi:small-conductance mechanosensitive channel